MQVFHGVLLVFTQLLLILSDTWPRLHATAVSVWLLRTSRRQATVQSTLNTLSTRIVSEWVYVDFISDKEHSVTKGPYTIRPVRSTYGRCEPVFSTNTDDLSRLISSLVHVLKSLVGR